MDDLGDAAPAGKTALGFDGLVAYDETYTGLALDMSEGERMADLMGARPILMLANHGVIVCGRSVAEAVLAVATPVETDRIAFTNSPYVTDMGTSCGANFVNAGSAGTGDGITIVEGWQIIGGSFLSATSTDQISGVVTHEFGHAIGMEHNFGASADPSNVTWCVPASLKPSTRVPTSLPEASYTRKLTWLAAGS